MSISSYGWIWEGQGIDPGVSPSVFGLGGGAEFFGLRKACLMFHPNDELSLSRLSHLDEVVCDITKWTFRHIQRTVEYPHEENKLGAVENYCDLSIATAVKEAGKVSGLSESFPFVTGAIYDDMKGIIKTEGYGPHDVQQVYQNLKKMNPNLKLWAVVYAKELEDPDWQEYLPYIDIVNLWISPSVDIKYSDDYLTQCQKVFVDKPIVMGSYLRDYAVRMPLPMELLTYQWECILSYLRKGLIQGYSILGTVLIDGQQEQAKWVRDFIAKKKL